MAWNSAEEIPDPVPLSLQERQRLVEQGSLSRAALVNRAAMRKKTPMELMATGEVTIHMPTRFEDDRTLPNGGNMPGIEDFEDIEVFGGTLHITQEMLDNFNAERGVIEKLIPKDEQGRTPLQAAMDNSKPMTFEDLNFKYTPVPEDPYALDDEIVDAEIVDE